MKQKNEEIPMHKDKLVPTDYFKKVTEFHLVKIPQMPAISSAGNK